MNSDLKELLTEISALYDCYMQLKESKLDKQIVSYGLSAIYGKLIEILDSDIIFPIIAKDNPNAFEDYIYNVDKDTPEFIEKIKDYLKNI